MPGDWCRGSAPARRATAWQDALELAKKCVLKGKSSPPPGAHLQWDHWRCLQWWYSDALKDRDFPEQKPTPRQGVFIWPHFQTQFPLALLTWSLILQSLCYSGSHPAQILPLCSNTAVPPWPQQSNSGAYPLLTCVTCSTWPLLRPMGWKRSWFMLTNHYLTDYSMWNIRN